MSWWRKERPLADIDDGTLEVLSEVARAHFEARQKMVQLYAQLDEKEIELKAELGELFEEQFPEQTDADMAATWAAVQREKKYRRRRGQR